jgi:sensor histidine kinase YesM
MDIRNNSFNRSLIIIIPLVGILIVGVFMISYGITDPSESLKLIIHGIVMTAGLWLGCIVIVTYLWKRYPWETYPLKHLLLEFFLILAYTLIFSSIFYTLEKKYWIVPDIGNIGIEIFLTLLITYFITALHESVFFYQQWKYNFSRSVRLEKDNLEAKYESLKAQVNPHFLFNSLNGLSTLVGDNPAAVEYVQNLSDLLRYMLKGSQNELVKLEEELAVTSSYIKLQLARFEGALNIHINIPEDAESLSLPPLALQMLVENCINHNIVASDKPLSIRISADKDSVTVTNNFQPKHNPASTGQGLKNIRGRYSFFTGREVEISSGPDTFSVSLPLLKPEI